MDQSELLEWDQLFIGRDEELKILKRAWTDTKSGEARFIVLKGESGFGKTKLIQKFYSDISSSTLDDPEHYWPDTLLKEQSNLHINPKTEEFGKKVNVPWLWWGIRWTNPEDRNQKETISCEVLSSVNHLSPHIDALSSREKYYQHLINVAIESGSIFAEIASLGLVGAVKNLYGMGKMAIDERQRQQEEQLSIHERQAKAIEQQLDRIQLFLQRLLEGKVSGVPALPVIIILDDAQWIDQDSLNFIKTIFLNAIERHWPLLIIATHWEQDWNIQNLEDASGKLPTLYGQLQQQFFEVCRVCNIDKMEGLLTIVNSALPGLLEVQAKFLCEKADGNPRLLHEIILELLGEPFYFKNQNIKQALTEDALQELPNKSFALHDVQTRRFRRMHQDLQTLLSYASFQGMRFIKDLVLELATELDKDKDKSDNEQTLSEAIHPYATIIEASAVIYEFRHRVFYDLAKARIDKFPTLEKKVSNALLSIGKAWWQNQRPLQLTIGERESFILLMLKIVSGCSEESDYERNLLIDLVLIYDSQGYYAKAESWVNRLEQNIDAKLKHQSFTLGFWVHYDLTEILIRLNRWSLVDTLLSSLNKTFQSENPGNYEPEKLRQQACCFELTGIFHLEQDQIDEALTWFKKAMSLYGSLLIQDETNEKLLNDVSTIQNRVGHLLIERDQPDAALNLYKNSLQYREKIIELFGENDVRLINVVYSQNRIADMLVDLDRLDEALELSEQTLKAVETLIEKYGESINGFNELSRSQLQHGRILVKLDRLDEAMALFELSLRNSETIVERWGETADRVRDVTVSQIWVADILKKQDRPLDALALYEQCLKTSEVLTERYGESNQRLRDISLLEVRIATALITLDRPKEAQTFFEQGLKKCENLIDRFGENESRLQDLLLAQIQVGDILSMQDRLDEAKALYQKSLNTTEILIDHFGENSKRLSNLIILYTRLGEILRIQEQLNEALIMFQSSLNVCETIIKQYGESAERLFNMSISQEKIGIVYYQLDQIDNAMEKYEISLKIREGLTERYGENADWLRALSISKSRVGDMFSKIEQYEKALTYYESSLNICNNLINSYGENTQRQYDKAASQDRISKILTKQDQLNEALSLAQSSLKIKENIIQLLGETEFHLRGRSFSQEQVGDVLIKLNRKDEALNLFEQVLDTFKKIIERYGENANRLENYIAVSSKLGTHSDEGSKKQRDYFEQALILNERRLLTYPQYAKQSVSDHEIMLKEYRAVAEKSGDVQYLQACTEFEERLSRYKSEHNL